MERRYFRFNYSAFISIGETKKRMSKRKQISCGPQSVEFYLLWNPSHSTTSTSHFLAFRGPNPDFGISKFVPPFIHFLSFWSWIFWEFNWICFHILLLRFISITNGTLFIWRSFSAIFSCMHSHHHRKLIHMFGLNETNEQNLPILLCFDFIFIFWIFQIFCLFFLVA